VEGSVFTADTTRREDSVITAKKAFIKIQPRILLTEGSANVSNSVRNFSGLRYWAFTPPIKNLRPKHSFSLAIYNYFLW